MNAAVLREYANFILCCATAGMDISEPRITWALRITGDLT